MADGRGHDRRPLFATRLPSAFVRRVVVVPPGCERTYDEGEWRDAIVVVQRGEIDLECVNGGERRFGRGDVLYLSPLPLRALRNAGRESAVLVAVSRRRPLAGDEFALAQASASPDATALSQKGVPAMVSRFVWFDLRATDSARAEEFYEKLFGWKVQSDGEGPAMIAGAEGPWASIVPHGAGEPAWVPYVQVESVDDATAQAVVLGATVLQDASDGPAGRFSTILDPGGAPVALWQPSA